MKIAASEVVGYLDLFESTELVVYAESECDRYPRFGIGIGNIFFRYLPIPIPIPTDMYREKNQSI